MHQIEVAAETGKAALAVARDYFRGGEVMKFRLNIRTGNTAFNDGYGPGPEVARILRDIADEIDAGQDINTTHAIRDVKGNTVGQYVLVYPATMGRE